MIRNRYLPLWLHRVCNGLLAAAICASIASVGISHSVSAGWLHGFSFAAFYLSAPLGIFFACITRRVSIVEGVAGGEGYDELDTKTPEQKS